MVAQRPVTHGSARPAGTVDDAPVLNRQYRAERAAQLDEPEGRHLELESEARRLIVNRERGRADFIGRTHVQAVRFAVSRNGWQVDHAGSEHDREVSDLTSAVGRERSRKTCPSSSPQRSKLTVPGSIPMTRAIGYQSDCATS